MIDKEKNNAAEKQILDLQTDAFNLSMCCLTRMSQTHWNLLSMTQASIHTNILVMGIGWQNKTEKLNVVFSRNYMCMLNWLN